MKWTKRERKAIGDSIKHWEKDIITHLREGDKIILSTCHDRIWKNTGEEVRHLDADCPLCKLIGLQSACDKCPYNKYYGYPCDRLGVVSKEHGHWRKFNVDPCLRTAIGMQRALKRLLIQEGTRWQV